MNLDETIVAAQAVVDALKAIKDAPVAPSNNVVEVSVTEADGTIEKFAPEVTDTPTA